MSDAIEMARRFLENPEDGNAADFVTMGDLRKIARTLLEMTPPSHVEECVRRPSSSIRREALEEAARVADEVAQSEREELAADKEAEGDAYDPYSYGSGFLSGSWVTAQNLAKSLRALANDGKAEGET